MDHHRHDGRRIIVTGAASGIGYATAIRLVQEGGDVTACDVNEAGLEALGGDERVPAGRLAVVVADITREHDIARVVDQATDRGPVDVLANVAGMMDRFAPIDQLTDDLWDRVFAVNVTGPMRLARAVLPGMLAAGRGSVVNVASRAGVLGGGAGTAYVASKHALIGLMRSIAALYASAGVRCNAICPGGVETGIASTAMPTDMAHMERWSAVLGTAVRTAQPDEIATVVSWLASDEASNVNGAVVTADAGWSVM